MKKSPNKSPYAAFSWWVHHYNEHTAQQAGRCAQYILVFWTEEQRVLRQRILLTRGSIGYLLFTLGPVEMFGNITAQTPVNAIRETSMKSSCKCCPNHYSPVRLMHTPADNLNSAVFKMQLDCICWKSCFYEAGRFLLSTKELLVEFVAQSIAIDTANFQKLLT